MTTSSNERRYWDSTNWISLVAEDEPERADTCQRILEDVSGGAGLIIISALTLAEVIGKRGWPKLDESAEETIARFFENSYVAVHDVTRAIAGGARRLSRRYDIHQPNDAIHLATALAANADVFETYNTNDFRHLGPDFPLEVREPLWQGNLRMDLGTSPTS